MKKSEATDEIKILIYNKIFTIHTAAYLDRSRDLYKLK